MNKYEELQLELIKTEGQRRELVKRIEKRENIVLTIFYSVIWVWAIIWWFIWFSLIPGKVNLFLSILIFTLGCIVSDIIIVKFFLWVARIVRRTTK